jgi:hypothetical protein
MRAQSHPTTTSRREESANHSAVDQPEGSEAFPGGKIGDRTLVARVKPLESQSSEVFLGTQLCELDWKRVRCMAACRCADPWPLM